MPTGRAVEKDFATFANCDQITVRLRIEDIRQGHPVLRALNVCELNVPIRWPEVGKSALLTQNSANIRDSVFLFPVRGTCAYGTCAYGTLNISFRCVMPVVFRPCGVNVPIPLTLL